MTRRQNWWAFGLVGLSTLVIVGGVAQSLLSRAEPPGDRDELALVPVQRLQADSGYRAESLYTAEVVPRRTSRLAFQRAGELVEVLVDEGARVEAGQVLARLDTRHLKARLQQTQAEQEQTAARLEELVNGPRPQTIRAAKAEVNSAKQNLERERRQLQRSEMLIERDAISRQEYEAVLFSVAVWESNLELAQSRLDELLAGTRPEQIEAQAATVRAMEASIASLQHDLEDTELRAPFSGLIVRRHVDEGTIVDPQTAIFELFESEVLEIHAGLPRTIAQSLRPGDSVPVNVDGREVTARVDRIVDRIEPGTRTMPVILTVESDVSDRSDGTRDAGDRAGDGLIVAGQTVRVRFDTFRDEPGFWVPLNALISDHRGLWSCFVWQAETEDAQPDNNPRGIVRRQSVEVLYQHNERAFVRGTLDEGDWLVIDGAHRVVDRQRVRVEFQRSQEAGGP